MCRHQLPVWQRYWEERGLADALARTLEFKVVPNGFCFDREGRLVGEKLGEFDIRPEDTKALVESWLREARAPDLSGRGRAGPVTDPLPRPPALRRDAAPRPRRPAARGDGDPRPLDAADDAALHARGAAAAGGRRRGDGSGTRRLAVRRPDPPPPRKRWAPWSRRAAPSRNSRTRTRSRLRIHSRTSPL